MKPDMIRAKSAGFCFGVKRAVDMVNAEADTTDGPIYTYGPIIHNESVVQDLEEKGVHVIPEGADLDAYKRGTVVIRSHGVTKAVYDDLQARGFRVVDATCPFVLKIHHLVEKYADKGYFILIIGNASHPEVQGIIGWISKGHPYSVVGSRQEAEAFSLPNAVPADTKICIVSQTTFNYAKFEELVEIIRQKGYYEEAVNTICNATEERQKEARAIAEQADVMLVIGGRNSSNTQKLYEICSQVCPRTYFIQTVDDLDESVLQNVARVGITAGASTPNYIIEEVQKNVRNEF